MLRLAELLALGCVCAPLVCAISMEGGILSEDVRCTDTRAHSRQMTLFCTLQKDWTEEGDGENEHAEEEGLGTPAKSGRRAKKRAHTDPLDQEMAQMAADWGEADAGDEVVDEVDTPSRKKGKKGLKVDTE